MNRDSIRERIQEIRQRIEICCQKSLRDPQSVKLIVVTKTFSKDTIEDVIAAGGMDIGENRVQEIVEKIPQLSSQQATIHLIGHLQSNKVAKAVPLVSWIHSVDSLELVERIDLACKKINKTMNVLIQVNTSFEESKSGCDPEETIHLFEKALTFQYIKVRGLMTIGPLSLEPPSVRKSFSLLRQLAQQCSSLTHDPLELSMGMSSDFELAIEEGSTMVRIGSLILGDR